MAIVKSINSDNGTCTVVLEFDLCDLPNLAIMSQVLGVLAGVQIKEPPALTSAKGVKPVKGVSVPSNFLSGIANKIELPGLVKEASFVALCARFLQDETLAAIKGGGRSDQAAKRITEWTERSENLDDLSLKLTDYAGGSPDEFRGLAEILFAHFKPENESVIAEPPGEDAIVQPARELAWNVARMFYINSQLAESWALIRFCEVFIQRGITQPSKIRESWDPMTRKAAKGVEGIIQLLVDDFGLSPEDENMLALANALQERREFLDLAYVLAGKLDRELADGNVPFDEAHFKGVSAYYALLGKLWRESRIQTLEEAQAAVSNILDRATSREQFEDILANEFGLKRSGQPGSSLRALAYTFRTLKTIRRLTETTQETKE